MSSNLRGRNFLKELDFTPAAWRELLTLSASLKADKAAGNERKHLSGKNIALIFEKSSTRTRCAFEVAAFDQGAHVTYLDPSGSQIGHKESMKDTARVLGRMYDGIQYRGHGQELVETLGEFAGVPVWNGLTDEWHPTQTLCDMLTMREWCAKPDAEMAFAFCGDTRSNVGNSLLVAGAMMGMDVRMVGPRELWNPEEVIAAASAIAETTGDPLAIALVLVDVAPRIEAAGVSRIGDFMKGNLDGFESLDAVADAISAYNPHRPRPKNLDGLKKNLRQRADGRWMWHWDPRFVSGRFGSPDETRSTLVDGDRLQRAARTLTIPTLLVRGRMSDLLSEEGARELLELVPHAQLADVAGAGHMVAGDRNDAFNDAVVGFLATVRPR